jgi:hypothetical protein
MFPSLATRAVFRFLRTTTANTTIFLSPNCLSLVHVSLILVALLFKPIFQILGWSPSIKTFSGTNGSVQLPELLLTMPLVMQDGDVQKFLIAVDIHDDKLYGPQLAMFLSAMTEPTMLVLIAHRKCPIQPLGSVNVRNSINLLRPDLVSILKLREPGVMWLIRATLKKETKWVKRGIEFEILVSLWRHAREGEGEEVFQQVFAILQFVKHSRRDISGQSTSAIETAESRSISSTLQMHLEAASPCKWAAICKDYNPIHSSALLARVFGFPGKLAHGNLVLARILMAAESQNIWASTVQTEQSLEIKVDFKRPVLVLTNLLVDYMLQNESKRRNTKLQIHVRIKDKICVEVSVELH